MALRPSGLCHSRRTKRAPLPADTDLTKIDRESHVHDSLFFFYSLFPRSLSSPSLPPASTSSSMLLARNPVPLPMSPLTSHRRHPSAPPAVVVQPTKVPGILSISKPLRPDSPRQHHNHGRHAHRSPKPKQPQPHIRSAQDGPSKLAQDKPSPDVSLPPVAEKPPVHPPTPTHDKSPRGRQTKAPKDKGAAR